MLKNKFLVWLESGFEMSNKVKDSFIVVNEKGLHTRPSTELVKCAASFKSQITLMYQNLTVNAKSLLGILMLAAARGAKIHIEATGEDAEDAVKMILNLARNKFNIKY
jgi:phosphocarrier protein